MKKISTTIVLLVIISAGVFAYRDTYRNNSVEKKVGDSLPQITQKLKSAIAPLAVDFAKSTVSNPTPSTGASTSNTTTDATNETDTTLTNAGVIQLTNENRKENGNLPGLTENAKLDQSAEIKMKDMFAKQYFEHVSPSGVSVSNLADRVSYDYIVIGENLAMGDFTSNKDLVDAWMASPGHRANILNNRYTEIGVAVGRGMYQGQEVWMAVQHFGAPKSLCPTIDATLDQKILQEEAQIQTSEANLSKMPKTTNQEIETYNAAVRGYNQLVDQAKNDITTYNAQVKAFDACVKG